VTLWEILTFAREQPFENLSDEKVIENIGHIYQDNKKHVRSLMFAIFMKYFYTVGKILRKLINLDRKYCFVRIVDFPKITFPKIFLTVYN
jgi:hypothetical protein